MNILKSASISLLMVSLPCTLAASVPPTSGRSVKYTVTDIGTLGGSESEARALNEAGEVVGGSTLATPMTAGQKADKAYPHAFLWEKGKITDLDKGTITPVSNAQGINNQGECVGTNHNACLWEGGHCQSLGTLLVGNPPWAFSMANSINDRGQICGVSDANGPHAFLWEKGKMTNLTPGHNDESNAFSINESGQIAGWSTEGISQDQATVWSHGKVTLLGLLPGGKFSEAYGLNDAGQVVGGADNSSGHVRGFFWSAKQGLVCLKAPAVGMSRALGINRQGQIVGLYDVALHFSHACLWQHGVVKDLNERIPPQSGWVLKSARAINNHGQIVGTGLIHGQKHAFLLTPKTQ